MASLLDRYADKIQGVLSCFDRVVIQGTLPGLCYAEGMTRYLNARGVRIFDYPKYAQPLRDQIRANAEQVAAAAGVQIEFIRRSQGMRKEERIKQVLQQRGQAPGLVHILSAMEECGSYQPWHDKKTGRTYLKPDSGKCLHYYFYLLDPQWGLCYLRVPTWCPFRLQFYFNGHNWLATRLKEQGVGYQMLDNALVQVDDVDRAQKLADTLDVSRLHQALDRFAQQYCPVLAELGVSYHWSLMQVEYATDILFRSHKDLEPLYEQWVRTAVHAVKAQDVATFLGRKLHGNFEGELGNDLGLRVEGTRIKHSMGPASIKMYDKRGIVLRIETTVNDVAFFKHHRKVEQRDGTWTYKLAPVRKTIYSLDPDLRELLAAANRRYLDFLSALDDPSAGIKTLDQVSKTTTDQGHRYKGFNFFAESDQTLFQTLLRAEFVISGMRNKDLRRHLPDKSSGQVGRFLKRLRCHGLLKKVGRTYKYYLTELGRHVASTGLKLKELFLIPALAHTAS